jgi:hypothetical protein
LEVSAREVINVMVDGGKKVCDYAEEQWLSGKYDGDDPKLADMRRDNLKRWSEIRKQINVLAKQLRELHPK